MIPADSKDLTFIPLEAARASLYPWAELRLIPSVFYRINPQDYAS